MTVQEAYCLFINWLKLKQSSPKTIVNYVHSLKTFVLLHARKEIDLITLTDFRKHQEFLHTRNYKPHTYKNYCINLRAFARFLYEENLLNIRFNRIFIPKAGDKEMNYLTVEESKIILNSFADKRTIGEYRDHALFLTLYATGCRISEALNLNRITNGQAQVIGKGQKLRTVFFSQECEKAINEYLNLRADVGPALFISHANFNYGDRLGRYVVQRNLQRRLRKLGIQKRITPHTFRHTFACRMLENGASLYTIQTLLGHSSLSTTQKYLHISNESLKKDYHHYYQTISKDRSPESSARLVVYRCPNPQDSHQRNHQAPPERKNPLKVSGIELL